MKRDMDLWRRLLLDFEAVPANQRIDTPTYPEYDTATVNEHLELLIEAGLLHGQPLRGMEGLVAVNVQRLTNHGHDFLANIRHETVWQRTKEKAKSAGGSISIDVVVAIASLYVKQYLGLPPG